MAKFLLFFTVVLLAYFIYNNAFAATIEVYVLTYQGETISLATDMALFECENLMNEIQAPDVQDLSCVKVEVHRELI